MRESKSQAMPAKHVVLIHGTWASSKMWSEWEKRIESDDSSVRVTAWKWSGKNSSHARSETAKKLAKSINAENDRLIHLVGHSHGGTIAALAMNYVTDKDKVVSLTTLATPFPTIFYRNLSSRLAIVASIFAIPVGAVSAVLLTLIFSCVLLIPIGIVLQVVWRVGDAFGAFDQNTASFSVLIPIYNTFITILYSFIALCATLLFGSQFYWVARIKLLNSVRRIRCEIEILPANTRTLCLSPSGDEVMSYLNLWSSVQDIPYILMGPYMYVLIPALSGALLAMYEVFFPGVLMSVDHDESFAQIRFGILALLPLLTTTLLYMILVMLGYLGSLMSLTPLGFGMSSWTVRMTARINALPTPLGWRNVQFQEIDMNELSHSQIHKADSTYKNTCEFQSWCMTVPSITEVAEYKIRRRVVSKLPRVSEDNDERYMDIVGTPIIRMFLACYGSFFGIYTLMVVFQVRNINPILITLRILMNPISITFLG